MKISGWMMLGVLAGIGAVGTASAQQASQNTPPTDAASDTGLEQVTVTATRHVESVHDVPMSISAVTDQNISEQGIKTANDLVQMVPGLSISLVNGGGTGGQPGNPSVAIRGITSSVGASTTGIYLDDVPLQQRDAGTNAAVFPQLFDLERVEVLRGPQGTLYGGSSEGGTIRFITPQPSFTQSSAYSHMEGSGTQDGDPNYEVGLAAGGPIVDDTVAARASAWMRHDGGYIDHVSLFTGDTLPGGENTNSEDHQAFHGALAWKPVGSAVVTLSYYYLHNDYRDSDEYWGSIPQYQNYLGPGSPGTLETYCPCNFGPYKTGENTNIGKNFYTSDAQLSPLLDPHSNSMSLPSLTIDYGFNSVDLKLVSAYTDTKNSAQPNYAFVATASRSVTPLEEPYNSLPDNGPLIATLPNYFATYQWTADTKSYTEELRATSTNPDARVTWVAGLFYDYTKENSNELEQANVGDLGAAVKLGLPSAVGTPFASLNGTALIEPQSLSETQEAAYAQATLKITQQLHLLGGIRVTRDSFSFYEAEGGSVFGYPPGVVEPLANGSVTQKPVTPLGGLQYVVNPDLNFYATAAKGFRAGGVNNLIPPTCDTSLAQIGYTNGNVPTTYRSDSLWSYEIGSKAITWGDKASLNGSVYYIDWPGVQTALNLTCGQTVIVNAAKAISKGGDLQAAAELFPGFIAKLDAAYTDSYYSSTVTNGAAVLIASGSQLPGIPKWSGTASAEYHFKFAKRPAFFRLDYSYQGATVNSSAGPGTSGFLPDAYALPANKIANARLGMTFADSFDVQAFVANLTNSQDTLSLSDFASGPGRVGCKNAACTAYQEYAVGSILTTFRPRTFGLDVDYRF